MPPRAGRYGLGGDFDEVAHPRWPRGAPDDASGDGQGGRFRDRADAVRGWAEGLADSIRVGRGTRPVVPRRTDYNEAVMQAARDQVAENERNGYADPDLRYRLHDTNLIRDTSGLDHMVDQLRAYIAQRYPERDRQLPWDIVDHHDGTPAMLPDEPLEPASTGGVDDLLRSVDTAGRLAHGGVGAAHGWDDQSGDHWLPTGARTLREMAQNLRDAQITSGFGPDQDEHPVMDTVRQVFDYEDFDTGYYAQVTSATWSSTGYLQVEGRVYAADGTEAGKFTRHMHPDGHVHHSLFRITDPEAQGGGFTARWFEQVKQQYREQGFDRVTVHADIDVGGYAWAKLGFDFESPDTAEYALQSLRETLNEFDYGEPFYLGAGSGYHLIYLPHGVDRQTEEEVRRLERRVRGGERISAAEIAMLGYRQRWDVDTDPNRPSVQRAGQMWLGKAFMLRYSWHGEMFL